MQDNGKIGYIELTRVIMATNMKIPPDDIDMSAIFRCVQRAIEEQVERNLDEPILTPSNQREIRAVISEVGETIIPLMFNNEYPFTNFVEDYKSWYEENLVGQFLKMKIRAMNEESGRL